MGAKFWWHAYSGFSNEWVQEDPETGETEPAFYLMVAGLSTMPPEKVIRKLSNGAEYRRSWNHEPSEAEKMALYPPEYREEEELDAPIGEGWDDDGVD